MKLFITLWLFFQLTIQARDMGTPPKSSQENARVTVRVARNLNSPKFEGQPFTAKLTRDAQVGTPVKDVLARDDDQNVRLNIKFLFM